MSDIGWPTVVTACTSTKNYVNALIVQCITVKIGYHLRNPSPSIDFHEVLELGSTYHPLTNHIIFIYSMLSPIYGNEKMFSNN